MRIFKTHSTVALFLCVSGVLHSAEPESIWPDLAPGESSRETGEALPPREGEKKAITRVVKIRKPTFTVHIAAKPNGAAVVILPGGGFGKVVPDMEGTEAAEWLNRHGVSAFVLSYRTKLDGDEHVWKRALQDGQRAMSVVRSRADEWGLKKDKIGLFGFSAGGQAAARLLSDFEKRAYDRVDAIDDVSYRPDFAILVYPWNLYDKKTDALAAGISVSDKCPPTFMVHTDDDRSSALGTVLFYTGLKRRGIPAELHVYGNGGHGYGLRDIEGSQISSWPGHAVHWLNRWMAGKK